MKPGPFGKDRLNHPERAMVFRLKGPRPTFALDMSDAEREIMARHAEHWRPRGGYLPFMSIESMLNGGKPVNCCMTWTIRCSRTVSTRPAGPGLTG